MRVLLLLDLEVLVERFRMLLIILRVASSTAYLERVLHIVHSELYRMPLTAYSCNVRTAFKTI